MDPILLSHKHIVSKMPAVSFPFHIKSAGSIIPQTKERGKNEEEEMQLHGTQNCLRPKHWGRRKRSKFYMHSNVYAIP